MELSPSEIRYCQDSISSRFRNKTPLTYTFALLLSGQLNVSSLPELECMKKDGSWYAVSGNRRLFLYKHLQNAGRLSRVAISVVYSCDDKRFTTGCNGVQVRCRGRGLEGTIQQIITEWRQGVNIVAKYNYEPVSSDDSDDYCGGGYDSDDY